MFNLKKEIMGRSNFTPMKRFHEILDNYGLKLMEVGTKALGAGNTKDAYAMFDKAYDLYSLFWGINMNLIDLTGVRQAVPAFYDGAVKECKLKSSADAVAPSAYAAGASKSTVRRLGDWVKNAVNCCIE